MVGDSNDLQNLNDEQYLQGSSGQPINFAAATDSFVAGSSSGLYQESNPGLSNEYRPSNPLMFDDLQNQNDSSSDVQYPQGSHSGQPFSFAAATDSFIAGSSSGLYQESNPGPSNQYHPLAPLMFDDLQPISFAAATNNVACSSCGQCREFLPSTRYHRSAPSINVEQYLGSFPPGYLFRPTDLELVEYYLLKKVMENPLPPNRIWNINVYQHDPDKLTGALPLLRETEWYFFSSRMKKYPKGDRPDRATPGGYWKPTGADINIFDQRGKVVGKKRVLDFYKGKPKDGQNEKATWKMHEYVLSKDVANTSSNNGNDMLLDKVVMCKIYQFNAPNGSNPQRAAGTNLQGDGSTNSTTCEQGKNHSPPQGSHFEKPIGFAPATNSIASSPSGLQQKSFPSTQYNQGPSNQDQSTLLVSGLGITSLATTTMNSIRDYPSEQYQVPSTQHNMGPSDPHPLVPEQGDTDLAAATNNIPCFPCRSTPSRLHDRRGKVAGKTVVLDFYKGKPQERNWTTNWNSTVPGNNMLLDDFRRATGSFLQGDGSSSSNTCEQRESHPPPIPNNTYSRSAYPQGGHFVQPVSFAPSTDNITGISGMLYEESFHSMQYNHGPSNQNQSALLVSGLGVTSSAAAAMNSIPSFPSEQYQEPFSSTQYNLGPSNENHHPAPLVSGLGDTSLAATAMNNILDFPGEQNQEPFSWTHYNQGPSNHNHQSTLLVSGLGVTSSAAAAMNNISDFPSEQNQEPFSSTQYNLGPSNQNHQSAPWVSGLGDTSLAATAMNNILDFPTSSAAAAMNNISDFPSEQNQEPFSSTQYNLGPSNQNHQSAPLASGLGVNSLAAAAINNIPDFPSEQYQEPFSSTQYNVESSNQNGQLVSGLEDTNFTSTTNSTAGSLSGIHQEPIPSTQCNTGPSNPYQLAHLELAQSLPLAPHNLDQEQMPSLVTGHLGDNNVNRLPSHLDHHSTPLVPGAVDSTTTPPVVHPFGAPPLVDDYFDGLNCMLQDPSLRWIINSFNNTDGKS